MSQHTNYSNKGYKNKSGFLLKNVKRRRSPDPVSPTSSSTSSPVDELAEQMSKLKSPSRSVSNGETTVQLQTEGQSEGQVTPIPNPKPISVRRTHGNNLKYQNRRRRPKGRGKRSKVVTSAFSWSSPELHVNREEERQDGRKRIGGHNTYPPAMRKPKLNTTQGQEAAFGSSSAFTISPPYLSLSYLTKGTEMTPRRPRVKLDKFSKSTPSPIQLSSDSNPDWLLFKSPRQLPPISRSQSKSKPKTTTKIKSESGSRKRKTSNSTTRSEYKDRKSNEKSKAKPAPKKQRIVKLFKRRAVNDHDHPEETIVKQSRTSTGDSSTPHGLASSQFSSTFALLSSYDQSQDRNRHRDEFPGQSQRASQTQSSLL